MRVGRGWDERETVNFRSTITLWSAVFVFRVCFSCEQISSFDTELVFN